MKILLNLLAGLFLVFGFGPQAYAGFLIEPFVNFAVSGDYEAGSSTGSVSTSTFGARAGLTTLGFMYGLEYSTGPWEVDYDAAGVTNDKGNATDLGLFVGYEFPVLIRVWATYYLQSDIDVDGSTLEYSGGGTELAVGYSGLPFVSINLSMSNRTYDEISTGTLANDIKFSTFMLGLSLPLP